MTAEYRAQDGVAIITLNNPPVNGLGHATRSGVVDGLQRALDDATIQAVVIIGGGKVFCGGADIREFNTPKALQEPILRSVIDAIEASPKPVVAAVHGVAMGGGLELALGCHYRVMAPGAQLALPEVKLGILPGAGGTQRLPRAIGLAPALDMIVSGNPVKAEKLADTALIDQLAGVDLLADAIAFAQQAAARPAPYPRLRDRTVEHPEADSVIQHARAAALASAKHFPAPHKCVDAIEAAVKRPFDEGLAFERACFLALVQTPESKALRHAFFAERAASKIADVPSGTPRRDVRQIAVIGAGTMGGGIAMSFINAGLPVTLLDTRQEALDRALAAIRANYAGSVKKGRLGEADVDKRMALLSPTLAFNDVANADLVIEAVFEDMALKRQVFGELDAVAKPGAILATNTSTLDVDAIAATTSRPQDVLGMHFFSPANVMKLLEVVRGKATGKDVLATVMALAGKIGKTAVVSGVCDGFIGNRMLEQYFRQAWFMAEEGALPQQIDAAIEAFGFAMGPFRVSDLAGNDISWAIRKRRYVDYPDVKYPRIADRLCETGRFGQKTGAGWYDYTTGDRTPRVSPVVTALIEEDSRERGVTRRAFSDEEIVERLVYALINEGARILDEGIAAKASDIDIVYLTGYGFPRWRGGPMFYADAIGLPRVLDAVRRYHAQPNGECWQAAPLLERLAKDGKTFNN